MLGGVQLLQGQCLTLFHVRQHGVFTLATGGDLDPGVTVEFDNPALGVELVLAGSHRDHRGYVLGVGHLAGDKLAPDQLVQPLGIALHVLEGGLCHIDV